MKRNGNYNNVILKNSDLIGALTLVQNYFDHVEFLNRGKNEEIAILQAKAMENIKKSEEILDGFTTVKFIGKDGKLMIASPESDRICFKLSSFSSDSLHGKDRSIELLSKRIEEYYDDIAKLEEKEKEARKAIQEYTPVKPKKVKHSFGLIKWEKVDNEYAENQNKKNLKKLNDVLSGILTSKEDILFQIKCNELVKDNISKTRDFIISLSGEDRIAIHEKYHAIKDLFYENEDIYAEIARIEKLKTQVLSLSSYMKKYCSEADKVKFGKFTAFIDKTYADLNEQQRKKSAEKLKTITDLTKYIDFGEYTRHIDCVALSMDNEKKLADKKRKEERAKANEEKQKGKKKCKVVHNDEQGKGRSL